MISVTVHDLPIVELGADYYGCFDTIHLDAGNGMTAYNWNNGLSDSQILAADTSGNYFVNVVDVNGCENMDSIYIDFLYPYGGQEICVVTVDSASEYNLVVWEKPIDPSIREFNIYRQSDVIGIYNLIGVVSYDSLSVFVDSTALPREHEDYYKISVTDTCGNESELSPYHKTMYVGISSGPDSSYVLEWTPYLIEGYPDAIYTIFDGSYYIYRGTDTLSFGPYDTLAGNIFNLNVYASGLPYFRVGTKLITECAPANLKFLSGPYSHSISNIEEISNGDYIEEKFNDQLTVLMYPNPAKNILNIELNAKNVMEDISIRLIDVFGRQVYCKSFDGSVNQFKQPINISSIAHGLYWINIETGNQQFYEKLVISR